MSLFVLLFGCAILVVGMQDFFIRHTEIDKDFLTRIAKYQKNTNLIS